MSPDATLNAAVDPDRAVISVTGPDAEAFLQGLLTNDVTKASAQMAVYAALLTPQGKFIADMFVARPSPDRFLLDVDRDERDALIKRLSMYKLRAKAEISAEDALAVVLIWIENSDQEFLPPAIIGDGVAAAFADPRSTELGNRVLTDTPDTLGTPYFSVGRSKEDLDTYERLRVSLGVPKGGVDLVANETFPLEAGFEAARGVDFRKGCFVGQEVTARMRHKAVLKKRLVRLKIESGAPAPGAEIRAGDRPAGRLGSVVGDEALAVLRVDRLEAGSLTADGAVLTPIV